ncbi:GNAT family N-acetyltransferase [Flexivirga caeni]|nr:GNAT family N-acetyltransferase [Flexivirga caeni]
MPTLDTLQTDRLLLRPQRVDEAAVYRQLWVERDSRVPARRRIDPDGRPTVDDIAARLRESGDDGPGLLAVELRATSEVIGLCGLILDEESSPDEPELAYELFRSAHGQGYASEAALAVVQWARAAGYRELHADVWDWNFASRRVLEKLGFREVGARGASSAHGQNLLAVLKFDRRCHTRSSS